MNSETVKSFLVLCIIFGTGVVIAVSIAWLEFRKRTKALDVLRVYAERGEEPPPSVVQALAVVSGYPPPRPATPPNRANHMAHLAGNIVALLGSAGIAWWRMPSTGEPGALVIVAVMAAIFFAMATAAYLVSVFTTPPIPHFENDMAHVAANTVGVFGSVGMAWWRMPRQGEPGPLVICLVIAAIFFSAMLVARLVTVFATRRGGRPNDGR
jgi:hypothetical protein